MFSWEDDAECRRADPVLFFGPDGERPADREVREAAAKRVCAACPVRAECLDWALSTFVKYGVWGGMNPEERKLERRRRLWRRKSAA